MEARPARTGDGPEIVRLAAIMYGSMGMDLSDPTWEVEARRHVAERLGHDLAIFVVDHPRQAGRLVAAAAGTMAARLPAPINPSGVAGYVQWVCTDVEFRGRGLGRQVITNLLEWYESRGVAIVDLHASEMGERLYRSLGFDEGGQKAMRRQTEADEQRRRGEEKGECNESRANGSGPGCTGAWPTQNRSR